ncbi:glutamate receptor ionotropic, delta-2-like, partial [Panulirus ornatus]|uniref:glutamate receptor ionotropic, delta-2-like n=1 Tax=Panulirus ornatus TaxID=150431 RepID=UPI003A867B50
YVLTSRLFLVDPGLVARLCSEAWVDTILLRYDPGLVQLESLLRSSDNVLGKKNVVVFCSRSHTLHLFQQVRARMLESTTVQWFVVVKEELTSALQDLLREGTQVVLLTNESAASYKLATARVNMQGKVRFEAAGNTHDMAATSLYMQLVPDLLQLYTDFHGRQLVVSANDNWPFLGLTHLPDGRVKMDSGIDVNIINTLSTRLNFTYRTVVPEDRAWGGPREDGSVTGLIGMVARHEAQVAICEITITDQRETVVDFTAPYWLESLTLVSRAPKERDRSLAVFWPFSTMVWVLIVVATAVLGPAAVWLVHRCRADGDGLQPTLHTLAFNVFRSLVGQGNTTPAPTWSLRLLFGCWYFFCYNIYAMYAGVLTAVLAVPVFEKPVDSLSDLPASAGNGFIIGTLKDSSTEVLFRKAESGIYKEVWELFRPDQSLLPDPEIGFSKVLKEKFVLINSELNAEIRATVRGREKYHFGRDTFYPHGYGIACITGAPFRPVFDKMLSWVTEAGLIDHWAEEEIRKLSGQRDADDPASGGEGPGSLTLNHVQAAFFLLLTGAVVSTLAFVLEMFFSR